MGSRYRKALYLQYTDGTFAELEPRTPEWEHLGVLGPVIHAEVCDTIVVIFKNNAGDLGYLMHPHGVFYEKDSKGAGYNDGTSDAGDVIPPGERHTYVWPVPPRARSGPNDQSPIPCRSSKRRRT
ncbi:MAG: hypothetical protein EB829_06670 [Nitrosopumilus sp. H8]|nr:MAG: hypothetical protein EB829_06670 [Nitrosopumilus sp. H8]